MNHTGNKNIEHKQKQYNDGKHHDSQGSCNNICAIQLLYWAPQTYRTRRNTIVILGTTLAQHKHLCNTIVILGTTNISHAVHFRSQRRSRFVFALSFCPISYFRLLR